MRNSIEYPKTENLFNRDPDTHKLIIGDLRVLSFGQVKNFHVTEKIDGMNMRVLYAPGLGMEVRGRSDRANVPADLLANMQAAITEDALSAQFDEFLTREDRDGSVTIFGEGYGPGIQKRGVGYSPQKSFRMFDILYHWNQDGHVLNSWAMQETVDMVAEGIGIRTAPLIGVMTLDEIVDHVDLYRTRGGGASLTALEDHGSAQIAADRKGAAHALTPEGVIARSDPYLYTHRGSRIMFKLKTEDLG